MKKTALYLLLFFSFKLLLGVVSSFEKYENLFWEQEVSNSDGDEKNNESEKNDLEDDSEKNKHLIENQFTLFSKIIFNSLEINDIYFLSKGIINKETPPPMAIG